MPSRLYYWQEVPNFGDALAPLLLQHFAGIQTTWSEPDDCDIVTIGSPLDMLPQAGWRGTVVGSGKLMAETEIDLTAAVVLGLRGPLTLRDVKVSSTDAANVVIGDPGLLAKELVNAERNQHHLGCVPHCSDTELFDREVALARHGHYPEPILIDPAGNPLEVVQTIGSCRKIITSSLHGIIVADAFGIPRRAEMFAEMTTNKWQGGDFKFLDYGESIGQPIEWGTLQEAPQHQIERMQYAMFDMFTSLKRSVSVASAA
jgi:pyruvyltransferase